MVKFILGTDIGGTFTDTVVMSEAGEISVFKVPSTPQDNTKGVLASIELASQTVGLRSYFLGCKFAIPAMLKNGGGVIINISSVGGMEGSHWYSHYNCVKAAIINLTRNIALDYSRQNIRSVCICPATIATEALVTNFPNPEHPFRKLRENMIPMGRVGKPEEVANLALFLASDAASFINGVAIAIDGGMTAGKFIHNWEEIHSAAAKK